MTMRPHHRRLGADPRTGLCQAVLIALRCQVGALVMGGPPCSSFVWINSATSRRSRGRPLGDTSKKYIRSSNKPLGMRVFFPRVDIIDMVNVLDTCIVPLNFCSYFPEPRLTARWTLILCICAIRKAFSLTEQPNSSSMVIFPYIRWLADTLQAFGVPWFETFLRPGYAL